MTACIRRGVTRSSITTLKSRVIPVLVKRLVGWSFNVPFQHKYGYMTELSPLHGCVLDKFAFAVLFRSGKSTGFRRTPPRLSSPYKTTEYNAKLTNRLLFSFLSDYIIVVCCRISPSCPADLPMPLDLNGALPSQTPWREPPPLPNPRSAPDLCLGDV